MKELLNSIAKYAARAFKKAKKFFADTVKTFKNAFICEEVADSNAETDTIPNPFDVMGNVCVEGVNDTLNRFGKKFKNKKKAENTISKIVSTIARVLSCGIVGFFMFNVIKAIIKILPIVIYYTIMVFAISIIVKLIMAVFNTAIGEDRETETVNV